MTTTDDRCESCGLPFDERRVPAMAGRQQSPMCEQCFMGFRRFYQDAEPAFDD